MNLNIKHYLRLPYLLLKLDKFFNRYTFDSPSSEDRQLILNKIFKYKLSKKELIKEIEKLEIVHRKKRLAFWNNFIENDLTKKHSNCKLKINKNPDVSATIVEAREHPHFKTIVQNVISNLQHLNIGLLVYHGTENENFVKNALKEYNNIQFINLNVKNIDIEGYNKIMLSKEFHKSIPTDKFLVFQTDVITFKPLHKKFLEYDYIGAPWKKEFHKEYKAEVGNGGLSIRSKKAMLKILELGIERKENQPEDLYLAQILKSKKFKVAPYNVAFEFSTEDDYNPNAFGCHKSWELIKTSELKQILY